MLKFSGEDADTSRKVIGLVFDKSDVEHLKAHDSITLDLDDVGFEGWDVKIIGCDNYNDWAADVQSGGSIIENTEKLED